GGVPVAQDLERLIGFFLRDADPHVGAGLEIEEEPFLGVRFIEQIRIEAGGAEAIAEGIGRGAIVESGDGERLFHTRNFLNASFWGTSSVAAAREDTDLPPGKQPESRGRARREGGRKRRGAPVGVLASGGRWTMLLPFFTLHQTSM